LLQINLSVERSRLSSLWGYLGCAEVQVWLIVSRQWQDERRLYLLVWRLYCIILFYQAVNEAAVPACLNFLLVIWLIEPLLLGFTDTGRLGVHLCANHSKSSRSRLEYVSKRRRPVEIYFSKSHSLIEVVWLVKAVPDERVFRWFSGT